MLRLLTLILTTLSVCVQSVDRKKFRTCDQTGFCRRNRGNVPKIKFKVSSIDTKDGTSFKADLLPVHVAHGLSHYHPLKMNIEVYDNMVVRVRVVEDYTKIEPQRYENPDVLVSRRRCDDAKISRSGDVSTVSCKGENILNVHHDMFRLDLLLRIAFGLPMPKRCSISNSNINESLDKIPRVKTPMRTNRIVKSWIGVRTENRSMLMIVRIKARFWDSDQKQEDSMKTRIVTMFLNRSRTHGFQTERSDVCGY